MSMQRKSTGEIIEYWRTLPEKRQLIENIYYDEDVLAAAHRYANSAEFKAILDLIYKQNIVSGQVLDIGGGNGVAALAWHLSGFTSHLVEPDMSDVVGIGALLPVLDRLGNVVTSVRAIGETLPYANASFDVVFGRQVLHHMTNLHQACAEIRRVLKPNGICIIAREHVISQHQDLPIFLENHPLHKYTHSEHAYLLEEYLEAFKQAGFKKCKAIGPLESVINYFPATESEHRSQIIGFLKPYVGKRLAWHLSKVRAVVQWVRKHLSERLDTPGRLYSFVAGA
jgi:ubiquinone/menaquinone biosynthesis C-methylase UbiE